MQMALEEIQATDLADRPRRAIHHRDSPQASIGEQMATANGDRNQSQTRQCIVWIWLRRSLGVTRRPVESEEVRTEEAPNERGAVQTRQEHARVRRKPVSVLKICVLHERGYCYSDRHLCVWFGCFLVCTRARGGRVLLSRA